MAALSACGQKNTEPLVIEAFYFDTVVSIKVTEGQNEEMKEGCLAILQDLENTFDRHQEGTELYRINHRTANTLDVSENMAQVLEVGLRGYQMTDGAFD